MVHAILGWKTLASNTFHLFLINTFTYVYCIEHTFNIYYSCNNNNNICLKSNIQTSSVDYAPRELTHACSRSETCSRSDTEAILPLYTCYEINE